MDAAASAELLGELYDHATEARFTYRHKWRAGDLTLFDGRASMHTATGGYTGAERRTLWRAFMGGAMAVRSSPNKPFFPEGKKGWEDGGNLAREALFGVPSVAGRSHPLAWLTSY